MAKVKNVIVAHKATMNQQMGGVIDIFGSFNNIIQPIFPHPMMELSLVLTFEEITKPTSFEVRLNGPEDDLISKGELTPIVDPFGIGKKIIDLNKFLVKNRGKYTLDIFEKVGDDLKFLKTELLFIADYPPQRQFTPEQIKTILSNPELIKTVKTDFTPVGLDKPVKLQHNLDSEAGIDEGYTAIPKDDRLEIDGKIIDLTGIRRQVEWMFGNPVPKQNPQAEETKKEDTATTEETK